MGAQWFGIPKGILDMYKPIPDNAVFVASSTDPGLIGKDHLTGDKGYVVAIAATNLYSGFDWIREDGIVTKLLILIPMTREMVLRFIKANLIQPQVISAMPLHWACKR